MEAEKALLNLQNLVENPMDRKSKFFGFRNCDTGSYLVVPTPGIGSNQSTLTLGDNPENLRSKSTMFALDESLFFRDQGQLLITTSSIDGWWTCVSHAGSTLDSLVVSVNTCAFDRSDGHSQQWSIIFDPQNPTQCRIKLKPLGQCLVAQRPAYGSTASTLTLDDCSTSGGVWSLYV